jgi:small subunit ribosomal protein S9
MATQTNVIVTTGRRKTATARVRLFPGGTGKVTVNEKDGEVYLYDNALFSCATAPLRAIETTEKFDIIVRVRGGGPNGQSTAISHGLARALQKFNPEWRIPLKKAGYLTRDPRERERKKSGQPGARKRFQFSKR